jgi:TRAP-type C4-dicarboxylate transport system permease large subunit
MDDLAFMVLATPIFFPTAIKLGYDPIWFGILICVNPYDRRLNTSL